MTSWMKFNLFSQKPEKSYQDAFIETLLDAKALSFGSFTLKSGRISPYFCNCGKLTSGKDIAKAGEALAHAINNSGVDYDVLFGPAYKGIPFVTAAAIGLNTLFNKNVDFAFNRKEVKDHGEGGNLVGCSLAGKKVFIIDDVITAGTAIKESIEIIRKAGGIPVGTAVLLDRQEKAGNSQLSAIQQVEKDYGIHVVSAIKCQDLFQFVQNSEEFKIFAGDMEKYTLQYGVKI